MKINYQTYSLRAISLIAPFLYKIKVCRNIFIKKIKEKETALLATILLPP